MTQRTTELTRADLEAYRSQGPGVSSGGELRFFCPIHEGDHQRSLAVNSETWAYLCHSCGAAGVLAELSMLFGKRARRLEPGFIRIPEAARLVGKTTKALQRYLERTQADPDCPPLRRIHGAIHRADFERLIASKSKPHGRGALVRAALESHL